MIENGIGACILAAGKGTRMHSPLPKVLMTLLNEPMLACLYATLDPLFPERVFTVIGHCADDVRTTFARREQRRFIHQKEQLGTGHALQCAWQAMQNAGLSHVLVANGDTPLMSSQAAREFVTSCRKRNAQLGFMSLTLDQPGAYGRVVRKNGDVAAIIEAKDFDPAVHGPETGEINAGIYMLQMDAIAPLLDKLQNDNKSGEYYITDLVGLAVEQGLTVHGQDMGNEPSLLGVNSPQELVDAEELLRSRIVSYWLQQGVCIRQRESVRIAPNVMLAPGVQLCGPCELYGATHIARGSVVESHCVLTDSRVGQGCRIKSFSHLEQADVQEGCEVGPYARLRPGTLLEEQAKVGNFVETKKTRLGRGAKASHLTYLGDTQVGAGCNIGAGTITCNYDGTNKHATRIEAEAFIGSNTSLVAPVTIGHGALVAAGSVITHDVPPHSLAFGRARQTNKERQDP